MAGRGCMLVALVASLRELPTALAVAGLVVVLVDITLHAIVAFARTPGGRPIFHALAQRIAPQAAVPGSRNQGGRPRQQRARNRSGQ
jgi:hypothetical protein